MNVLIIGYGSIGKRHYNVLNRFENIQNIDIVTKQHLKNKKTFSHLEKVDNLSLYDYFVIASETSKHYVQLEYLESKIKNKNIFCEKPLFETYRDLSILNNNVSLGYVLRFHPLLEKLHTFLENESILSINVNCGQYLPGWRPDSDYRNSYSAKKSEGGGVLLDLSHEIDYVQWLCGNLVEVKSYQNKISDLEIDSDDITTFIGKNKSGTIVNITIDYISKIPHRRVFVNTIDNSYELDFVNNFLIQKDKNGIEHKFSSSDLERDHMFENMHNAILNNLGNACTFEEAKNVMKTITTIQEQNNE